MMIENIKQYLEVDDNILFAVIFGSYASGKTHNNSDLDIGIFTVREMDLIKIGKIVTALEKETGLNIDLVELNNLYNKSPLLAYQIVTNHKVIFERDKDTFINFKRMTYLNYFDTQELRDTMRAALYNRINGKKFGKRNYA